MATLRFSAICTSDGQGLPFLEVGGLFRLSGEFHGAIVVGFPDLDVTCMLLSRSAPGKLGDADRRMGGIVEKDGNGLDRVTVRYTNGARDM